MTRQLWSHLKRREPARNLFVYGTLTNLNRLRKLTGKEFKVLQAKLIGYRVVRTGGYPKIVINSMHTTYGKLVLNVDAASMQKLDQYESELYRRIRVKVHLRNGRRIDAFVYVQARL